MLGLRSDDVVRAEAASQSLLGTWQTLWTMQCWRGHGVDLTRSPAGAPNLLEKSACALQ